MINIFSYLFSGCYRCGILFFAIVLHLPDALLSFLFLFCEWEFYIDCEHQAKIVRMIQFWIGFVFVFKNFRLSLNRNFLFDEVIVIHTIKVSIFKRSRVMISMLEIPFLTLKNFSFLPVAISEVTYFIIRFIHRNPTFIT